MLSIALRFHSICLSHEATMPHLSRSPRRPAPWQLTCLESCSHPLLWRWSQHNLFKWVGIFKSHSHFSETNHQLYCCRIITSPHGYYCYGYWWYIRSLWCLSTSWSNCFSEAPPSSRGMEVAPQPEHCLWEEKCERVKKYAPQPRGRCSLQHGAPVEEQTCFLVGNNFLAIPISLLFTILS